MLTANAPLVLRPDRATTGPWAAVGAVAAVVAIASGVADPNSLWVWFLALLATGLTLALAAQAILPSWFTVVADDAGVRSKHPWGSVELTWEQIHLARITRLLGESFLECWVAEIGSSSASRTTAIYLPMGADIAALHATLERHLGLADPAVAAAVQ